ncbi:MAG: EAL domain-containing protein [Lachnospiraceae bacterium]|nr:EAL domain-containing protein [Lachnospiraceae bacterium]
MKFILLFISLSIIIAVLLCNVLIVKLERNSMNITFQCFMNMSALVIMMYLAAVFVNSHKGALVFYAFYYLFMDILLILLFAFIMMYTQRTAFNKRCMNIIMIGGLVDGIIQLLNIQMQKLYSVQFVMDRSGYMFYRVVNRTGYFVFHLAFCYILIILICFRLLRKSVRTSSVFRGKYLVVLSLIVISVIFNALYMTLGIEYDSSVILYGVLSVALFYFLYYYKPSGLIDNLLSYIVKSSEDVVLCFDIHGKYLNANEIGKNRLRVSRANIDLELRYKELLENKNLHNISELTWKEEFTENNSSRMYEVKYKKLKVKGKDIGSYLVLHDLTEEIIKNQDNHYKATHDLLTGIYNRDYFYKQVTECLKTIDEPYCMVCTDIRNFKMINDIYGKQMGDEILIKVAGSLKRLLKGKEFCCRLRDDRFAVCMPCKSFDEEFFKREIYYISKKIGMSIPVNMYVGIYEISDPTLEVSVMCDRAYLAINTVKDNYQGLVVYYDDKLRKDVQREQRIVNEFSDAIAASQFQLFLQPQVRYDGSICGAEALIRWIHPELGIIPPFEFINVYERVGFISRLDLYVWEQACKLLSKWRDEGHDNMYISVNISPKDFYYLDLYSVFTGLVEKYKIHPSRLHLEITETAVISDIDKQGLLIEQLRDYGFYVEMDDFGSGFSSLNLLTRLNVDTLKIDMGFLRKSGQSTKSDEIIRSVIDLAKELDIHVITEGVETEEQLNLLREMGCRMFQGYYFAKPMKATEFESQYLLNNGV